MKAGKSNRRVLNNLQLVTASGDQEEYESCEFTNGVFGDLKGISFTDCVFKNSNFSNASFRNCKLQDVHFIDCKLIGANFSQSKDFGFCLSFENCLLDYASFDKKRLHKSVFANCRMHHVNFTQADLSKASISNCDFYEALFANTDVSGLDFTTSKNFLIDPELNKIRKAKFLAQDLAGLLYRHDIVIV